MPNHAGKGVKTKRDGKTDRREGKHQKSNPFPTKQRVVTIVTMGGSNRSTCVERKQSKRCTSAKRKDRRTVKEKTRKEKRMGGEHLDREHLEARGEVHKHYT